MTDHDTASEDRVAQAANLFDLRRIIGGLFIALGVLLTVMGLFESDAEIEKAAGVNINLWAGLGMLALGLSFMAWALLRPLSEQLGVAAEDDAP
jgi:xanthine/uracil/vitamin C permease (AzgA family)